MGTTVELDDDLVARLESHCDEGQSIEELIEELVAVYEQQGRSLQEGP